MRFDELPKEEGKGQYLLTFEANEAEVVAAAFKEYVYRTVIANPGSVENLDMRVADWDEGNRERSMRVFSFDQIIEILRDFHEDTKTAISEIPDISGIPPFLNDDIPRRFELGKRALALAIQTEKIISAYYQPTEAELTTEIASLEEGLKRLLDSDDR